MDTEMETSRKLIRRVNELRSKNRNLSKTNLAGVKIKIYKKNENKENDSALDVKLPKVNGKRHSSIRNYQLAITPSDKKPNKSSEKGKKLGEQKLIHKQINLNPQYQTIKKINQISKDSKLSTQPSKEYSNDVFSELLDCAKKNDFTNVEKILDDYPNIPYRKINEILSNVIENKQPGMLSICLKRPRFRDVANNSWSFSNNFLFSNDLDKNTIKLLNRCDIDISQKNRQGDSFLDLAIKNNNKKRIIFLLKMRAVPDIHTLSLAKEPQIISLLIRHGNYNYNDLRKNGINSTFVLESLVACQDDDLFIKMCSQIEKNSLNPNAERKILLTICRNGNDKLFDFFAKNKGTSFTKHLTTQLTEEVMLSEEFNGKILDFLSNKIPNQEMRELCRQFPKGYKIKGEDRHICIARDIEYKNGKIITIDRGFGGKDRRDLAYIVNYNEDGEKTIRYLNEDGSELTTATIDEFGNLNFNKFLTKGQINNFMSRFNPTKEQKYDPTLSILFYNQSLYNSRLTGNDIEVKFGLNKIDIVKDINNSKYDNKTHYYNFSIDNHNVQIVAYGGKGLILNTGRNFGHVARELRDIAKNLGIPTMKIEESRLASQKFYNCNKDSKIFVDSLQNTNIPLFIEYENTIKEIKNILRYKKKLDSIENSNKIDQRKRNELTRENSEAERKLQNYTEELKKKEAKLKAMARQVITSTEKLKKESGEFRISSTKDLNNLKVLRNKGVAGVIKELNDNVNNNGTIYIGG